MLKGDDVAVLGKGLHVLVSVVEEGEGGQGGPRRQTRLPYNFPGNPAY